jgi:hypothetical protein
MLKLSTRAWKATVVAVAVAGATLLAVPQASVAASRAPAEAPQDTVAAFPLPQQISAYEITFQADTGDLSGSGLPYGTGSLGVAMAPGTSPSIAAVSAGNTAFPNEGYVAVFQGTDGTLWYDTGVGSGSLGPAVAPGTSPAVATAPGLPDGFQAAWQGTNNHLWTTGPNGPIDTGLSMMSGTSPNIAVLPPQNSSFLPNGGAVAVFQGSDGHPWFYTAGLSSSMGNSAFMAPGTSPALVPTPAGPGSFQAVWQGSNNHLWATSNDGPIDTGLSMMPGTSPNITELPPVIPTFLPNGGYVAVFQGGDGHPWYYTASSGSSSMGNSTFMAPGTSPALIPTPSGPGSFEAEWQGSNNDLWTTGPTGPIDTGLSMMPGTSPGNTGVSSL